MTPTKPPSQLPLNHPTTTARPLLYNTAYGPLAPTDLLRHADENWQSILRSSI